MKTTFAPEAVKASSQIADAARSAVSVICRWSAQSVCLCVGVLAIAVMMLGFIHANLPLIILSSGVALLACLAAMESGSERKGGDR